MKKQLEGTPGDKRYSWNITRIKKMLRNEYYIGNSVHYRERTASFKDKTRLHLLRDLWMVVENTHEPMISKDQILSEQKKMDSRYRTSSGIPCTLRAALCDVMVGAQAAQISRMSAFG